MTWLPMAGSHPKMSGYGKTPTHRIENLRSWFFFAFY
jgi:hypothetical protein